MALGHQRIERTARMIEQVVGFLPVYYVMKIDECYDFFQKHMNAVLESVPFSDMGMESSGIVVGSGYRFMLVTHLASTAIYDLKFICKDVGKISEYLRSNGYDVGGSYTSGWPYTVGCTIGGQLSIVFQEEEIRSPSECGL